MGLLLLHKGSWLVVFIEVNVGAAAPGTCRYLGLSIFRIISQMFDTLSPTHPAQQFLVRTQLPCEVTCVRLEYCCQNAVKAHNDATHHHDVPAGQKPTHNICSPLLERANEISGLSNAMLEDTASQSRVALP